MHFGSHSVGVILTIVCCFTKDIEQKREENLKKVKRKKSQNYTGENDKNIL